MWSTETPNWFFQGKQFQKIYDLALIAVSSDFNDSFSKYCFLIKNLALKSDSSPSSGGQGS